MKRRGSSPAVILFIIALGAISFWYFGEKRQTNCYIEECDAILLAARREAQNSWTASGKQSAWKNAARQCVALSAPINADSEYVTQSRRFFNDFYEQVDALPGTGSTFLAAAAGFAAGYSDARDGTNYTPQVMDGVGQAQASAEKQGQSLEGLVNQYISYTRSKGYRTFESL